MCRATVYCNSCPLPRVVDQYVLLCILIDLKKSCLVMNSHLLIPVYLLNFLNIHTFLGIHTSLSLYICHMYYSSLIPQSWRQHLAPFHSPLTLHSLCFQHSMRYPVPVSYSILPSWAMTHHLLKSHRLGKRIKLRYIYRRRTTSNPCQAS